VTDAAGTVGSTYDRQSQRHTLTYPDGRTLEYDYHLDGQLQGILEGTTVLAAYGYDGAGRLQEMTRANGAVTQYRYDGADRLDDTWTVVSGTLQSRFDSTLNREGQRTAVSETLNGATISTAYGYDGVGRLATADLSSGVTYAYTYDTVGNCTSVTTNGGTPQTTQYDAANQVVGWTYDSQGNLLSDGTQTYRYDAFGRLDQTVTGGVTTTMAYRGAALVAQTRGGVTTRYTHDLALGLPEVLQTDDGTTVTTLIYGRERLATITGATRQWEIQDGLGSVRQQLTDAGAPVATQQYTPWGEPTTGIAQPFGFTGELQDATTGLVYLRARWYNPSQGTLLGRDPFEGWSDTPYSLHPYQYGFSDPISRTDPSGRCDPTREVVANARREQRGYKECEPTLDPREWDYSGAAESMATPFVYGGAAIYDFFAGTDHLHRIFPNAGRKEDVVCGVGSVAPGTGEAIDIQEFMTNEECGTGRPLALWERALSGLCIILPFVGGRAARSVVKGDDAAHAARAALPASQASSVSRVVRDAGQSM
jgi:RHS repeat-associated protein